MKQCLATIAGVEKGDEEEEEEEEDEEEDEELEDPFAPSKPKKTVNFPVKNFPSFQKWIKKIPKMDHNPKFGPKYQKWNKSQKWIKSQEKS